jgi:hypothetical protein
MRYGISDWKARRWIASAHALERLPRIAAAFSRGELGIDHVVELTRFATAKSEEGLIAWAKRVSSGCIRRRADLAARQLIEDVRDAERDRTLSWWYFDDGRRFGLEAELPAAQGAVVAKALDRLAESILVMPGEEGSTYADARRADALVALASACIAEDTDPDRATVVIHAQLAGLLSEERGVEIEGGPAIHPETAKRLACNGRLQVVIENGAGQAVGLGRMSREPSAAMMRQLRYRDFGCTFPGCGARRFTQAHHIRWWSDGGRTDLDNLVLTCSFHHKLVHELGWRIKRLRAGPVLWFRPDGNRHIAGPAPPAESPRYGAEPEAIAI